MKHRLPYRYVIHVYATIYIAIFEENNCFVNCFVNFVSFKKNSFGVLKSLQTSSCAVEFTTIRKDMLKEHGYFRKQDYPDIYLTQLSLEVTGAFGHEETGLNDC